MQAVYDADLGQQHSRAALEHADPHVEVLGVCQTGVEAAGGQQHVPSGKHRAERDDVVVDQLGGAV